MDNNQDGFNSDLTQTKKDVVSEDLNANPEQSLSETQTQSASETPINSPIPRAKVPKILILGLVLLFAIIISGGYLFYQNQKTENITTSTQGQLSPTPNPTSNWKIYRNENWGFELRYPPNWTYSESSWDGGENETSVDYDGIHLSPPSSTRGITQINVYKVKNNGLNIKDYFNKNDYSCCGPDAEPTYLGDEIMASEKVIVDGIEGRKALKVPEDIPIEEVAANWVVLEKDGEIFLISNYKDVKELDLDIEKVFDQILSTFKFIEDNDEQMDLWQPICERTDSSDFNIKVEPGDGKTHIARKSVESYINLVTLINTPSPEIIAISPEEKVYTEDFISKKITNQNLSVGSTISISCTTVEEAVTKARLLTISQKGNLQQYSNQVEEFGFDEWLRQVIEDSSEDLEFKPGIISF